jgi:acyl-CoA synthetase (AMP-forming)/AMP-acid ligase II
MVEIPDWGTVPRMLRDRARTHGSSTILTDGAVTMSVDQLRRQASAAGRALLAHGITPGDRVGIWAPNSWQWVVAAFGVWDVGAVVVPMSTRAKGLECADALKRAGVRLLFTVDGFLGSSYTEMLRGAAGPAGADRPYSGLPDLRDIVLMPAEPPRSDLMSWDDFLQSGDSVSEATAEAVALAVRRDDPFEILMTSGTTGEPKGVVLDGAQIMRAYWDWSEVCGLGEGDRYPIVSPFAHGFGINAGMLICVARLATMVPIAVFDPDAALGMIEGFRLTTLAGPPALFERILANPELQDRDTSSLRWAIVGAASVPTALVHAMRDQLGFERVTNAYGLIEGSAVTMTRAGDSPEVVASTAGRAVNGTEVRIVDEHERTLPAGTEGEIQVRGYGVMHGYWEAPELTKAALHPDGWLRTGDIGVLDTDGNLRIVGRKKDMFIVGGFNTYPAEIENLLLHDPRIAQVAVVGVPDERMGEVAWAYVVPQAGMALSDVEVIAWARANMSNYKVPRRVMVVDTLPVTANGKIEKVALRRRALDSI